jgi:hypothetical protein
MLPGHAFAFQEHARLYVDRYRAIYRLLYIYLLHKITVYIYYIKSLFYCTVYRLYVDGYRAMYSDFM